MSQGLLRPVYHQLEEDSRDRGVKSFERNPEFERFALWFNSFLKIQNKSYQKRRNDAWLRQGNRFWGNYDRGAAGTYKSLNERTSKEFVKSVSFMSQLV